MIDARSTIQTFLDAAAAKVPAPGGGSVTAMTGAMAVAMAEMVVNYSVGKKDLAAHEPALHEALKELTKIRQLFLQLLADDQAAFGALTELRKIAKTPGLGSAPAIHNAVVVCATCPQIMATLAKDLLALCHKLAPISNKYLLSDLLVAAELAMASVRCGIVNVEVNLPDITDARIRAGFEKTNAHLLSEARQLIQQVVPAIRRRMGATHA